VVLAVEVLHQLLELRDSFYGAPVRHRWVVYIVILKDWARCEWRIKILVLLWELLLHYEYLCFKLRDNIFQLSNSLPRLQF
jgi:hypothetical protein